MLGAFSLGLGLAQLAAPDRMNKLIGVQDTPKTRTIQRLVGVQEIGAGQGIFGLSPPTPVHWSRVAGDIWHLTMLARAYNDGKRADKTKLRNTIAAVGGIGVIDTLVAAIYQQRWPKEPTGVEPLPNTREDGFIEAHVEGRPAITIMASETEIRPRLQEFGIEQQGRVMFRAAPGGRGTEVVVDTNGLKDKVKADLRCVKQLIETGEVVRSDGAPEGGTAWRQLKQRPAQPLKQDELQKVMS